MKRGSLGLIVAVALAGSATGSEPAKPLLRAGAATSNITPPLDAPIAGNWGQPLAEDVPDELQVRCLVLDDGTTQPAFVNYSTTPNTVNMMMCMSVDYNLRKARKSKAENRSNEPEGSCEVIALSTADGKELWRCFCDNNVGSGPDFFVAQGLVWVGEYNRREGMLIHGLSSDAASVSQARTRIMQSGKYGVISVEQLQAATLPYADNVVNLVDRARPRIRRQEYRRDSG